MAERWTGALQIKHSSGAPTRLTKQQQGSLETNRRPCYSVPHEVGFTASLQLDA
ncbi:hypothetical protein P7H22_16765 [Paenibacillus larvae]|nr:hypothetical protein [Paenibacillus larvae]MDT2241672.1 hypothetical protein [Paenibacillus larvae]